MYICIVSDSADEGLHKWLKKPVLLTLGCCICACIAQNVPHSDLRMSHIYMYVAMSLYSMPYSR